MTVAGRESTFSLAIKGGTVVSGHGRRKLDVYVKGGSIAALMDPEQEMDADEVVDARGRFVLPGFVDSHVHFMEPGDASREDFLTGTRAAARQGVTTVIEHTHGWPVNQVERLEEKRDHLRSRAVIDYGLAAHVSPEYLEEIPALWRAGIAFFKAFTCTTHGIAAIDADRLLALGAKLAELGAPCLIHSEDDLMTARNERRLREAMRIDGGVIPEWRSREAELVAVGTVATIARITKAKFVIAHASNPDVIDVARRERELGSTLRVESCPQYLRLREDEVKELGALRKFTPPARIRNEADEVAMWVAFNSGQVQLLSSDHAPSTRAQKADGDIWQVHFGLPGIDTTAALMLTEALAGRTSLERIVRAYAELPAATYGLSGKGRLAPGSDADILIFDPAGERSLSDSDVVSRAGWTPYAGSKLRGRVVDVFLRGHGLVRDGESVEAPSPTGRFVPGAGYESGVENGKRADTGRRR